MLQKFDLAVQLPVQTRYFDEDDAYDPPENGRVFVVPSMLVYNEKKITKTKWMMSLFYSTILINTCQRMCSIMC